MTGPRRFSQAISEGDGISLVVEVDGPEAAERAQSEGAEGVLVYSGHEGQLQPIRDAISVPILFFWDFETAEKLAGADACIIDMASWTGDDILEHARLELDDHFELALRVHDEEQLEDALEKFDPELFVLTGKDQEALQRVLDLLPDVPAGKLAIADLPSTTRVDVDELERVGVDAVIVRGGRVTELVGELPPEV